jgi:hypothetical protein
VVQHARELALRQRAAILLEDFKNDTLPSLVQTKVHAPHGTSRRSRSNSDTCSLARVCPSVAPVHDRHDGADRAAL